LHGSSNQPIKSVMQRVTSGLVIAVIKFITHHFLHRSGSEFERAAPGFCRCLVSQKFEFMRGQPRNAGTLGEDGSAVFDELRKVDAVHHNGPPFGWRRRFGLGERDRRRLVMM